MIIVKTDNEKRFGVTVTMPGVGTVTPSKEDGTFEHQDESAVQELISVISDFYVLSNGEGKEQKLDDDTQGGESLDEKLKGEELKEKSETGEPLEDKGEGLEIIPEGTITESLQESAPQSEASQEQSPEVTNEDIKTALDTKTRAELQELCKPFPRKEWGNLNKGELVAYLIDKNKQSA